MAAGEAAGVGVVAGGEGSHLRCRWRPLHGMEPAERAAVCRNLSQSKQYRISTNLYGKQGRGHIVNHDGPIDCYWGQITRSGYTDKPEGSMRLTMQFHLWKDLDHRHGILMSPLTFGLI